MVVKYIRNNNFLHTLAPPESVAFINNPNPSPDDTNDYTSGSVTYNLTDPNVPKNVTVRCEVLDSRPKATVTWMIGNYAPFGVSTHSFNTNISDAA